MLFGATTTTGTFSVKRATLLWIALRPANSFSTIAFYNHGAGAGVRVRGGMIGMATTTTTLVNNNIGLFSKPKITTTTTTTSTARFASSSNNNDKTTMTTEAATSTTSTDRLFPEELNIIYDSKCNVCKLEIDWLARRDERLNNNNNGEPQQQQQGKGKGQGSGRKLKMTDLESDDYNPMDPANGNIGYRQGMEAIHAVTYDGKVIKGVPVFFMAYKQVGLGWLFAITKWPILSTLVEWGYQLFAKYRTFVTRGGSSVDELVQIYEERQELLKQQRKEQKLAANDCETCPKQ